MQKLICQTCNKEFEADVPGRKYCSKNCFKNRPSKNRMLCQMCKQEFDADMPKRKFCSNECRNKAYGSFRTADEKGRRVYLFGRSRAFAKASAEINGKRYDLDDPANQDKRESVSQKILLTVAKMNGTLDVLLDHSSQNLKTGVEMSGQRSTKGRGSAAPESANN